MRYPNYLPGSIFNELHLNVKKTSAVILYPYQKVIDAKIHGINVQNSFIPFKSHTKFLVIILNSNLSWIPYISP